MADRIGVIRAGELILVERKEDLMRKLGRKELTLHLPAPLAAVPPALAAHPVTLAPDGLSLTYTYDAAAGPEAIAAFLKQVAAADVAFSDLETRQTSLEEIFVSLVHA